VLQNKKRRTIGRSFRIDEKSLAVLIEEAEKQGVSVNSLLNRLLQQYGYLRYMMRYGAITLTKKGFMQILESCPEEKIRENGKNAGKTIANEIMMTMGVQPNYSFVTCLLQKFLSEFAGWFECDHHIKHDIEIFHLRHTLGPKWSIYLAEAATELLKSVIDAEVKITLFDSAINITIPKHNTL